jgi:hypothetical protein
MEEGKDQGFTVRDRRTVSPDSQAESTPQQSGPEQQKPPEEQKAKPQAGTSPLPEMDFTTFVLSLAATAQMGLGLQPDPHAGQTAQNLPAAKQMIDVLGMLKEKTRGNLGQEEQTLLDSVLADLRMLYVKMLAGK